MMIWISKVLNRLRQGIGVTEVPPATSGWTSVLFVLNNGKPKTFEQIAIATNINRDNLRTVLSELKLAGRIDSSAAAACMYWIKKGNKAASS